MKSPQQVALESEPPDLRSSLTTQVRYGRLTETVEADGRIQAGQSVTVPAVTTFNGAESIVTELPVPVGGMIGSGDVLLEVADRPLIVLAGRIPLVRDLQVGMTGDDVARLQAALADAGYYSSDPEGVFGADTASSLTGLYEDHGYSAPMVEVAESGRGSRPGSPVATSSEIAFLPNLPGRVSAVGGAVGSLLGESSATVSTSEARIVGLFSPLDADKMKRGDVLRISTDVPGVPRRATIVGKEMPATDEQMGVQIPVVLSADAGWSSVGETVRLSFRKTFAEKGVIAPMAAIGMDESGRPYVTLVEGDRYSRVDVEIVRQLAGSVLLRPESPLETGASVSLMAES